MGGGSEAHNLVYPSDMKVHGPTTARFFYSDVSVMCDESRFLFRVELLTAPPLSDGIT